MLGAVIDLEASLPVFQKVFREPGMLVIAEATEFQSMFGWLAIVNKPIIHLCNLDGFEADSVFPLFPVRMERKMGNVSSVNLLQCLRYDYNWQQNRCQQP